MCTCDSAWSTSMQRCLALLPCCLPLMLPVPVAGTINPALNSLNGDIWHDTSSCGAFIRLRFTRVQMMLTDCHKGAIQLLTHFQRLPRSKTSQRRLKESNRVGGPSSLLLGTDIAFLHLHWSCLSCCHGGSTNTALQQACLLKWLHLLGLLIVFDSSP